jgi:hypothetical protein
MASDLRRFCFVFFLIYNADVIYKFFIIRSLNIIKCDVVDTEVSSGDGTPKYLKLNK